MQPVSEFRDQLLVAAGAEPSRVAVFSCGHVVPPDQLLTVSLAAGPSGADLLFNYQNRAQPATVSHYVMTYCMVIDHFGVQYSGGNRHFSSVFSGKVPNSNKQLVCARSPL